MSQFGIIYNIPLYFSAVEQTSTSYAGLHLIPNAILASTASCVHSKWLLTILILAQIAVWHLHCSHWQIQNPSDPARCLGCPWSLHHVCK